MKKTLHLYKAQHVGLFKSQPIEDTSIIFEDTFPEITEDGLRETGLLFEKESKALEAILHDTLPGGTYDRLLAEMLDRRKSHFIVPFGGKK